MGKINVLPKHIYELIAAGEVVERPSSVVKELLENSIDAKAKRVTVEIKNGGIKYIRITDDGCGIAREDIRNAFVSHATSKIKCSEDLDSIFTLGFRGEALASVAAVGKIELLTKTEEENIGSKYEIGGGCEISLEDAGCPDGTTIIIRDLFYNTPARMKFLKKDMTEGNYVADVVTKIALSHPEISIRLIKDNKQTLFTPGDGKLMTVISSVYGREFAAGLIECHSSDERIKVTGFISKPLCARPNRTMQHCFVNGRYVKIPVVSASLDNAYKNRIMVGKYPSCVLFMEIDPRLVDVNVHPAKTQVRFADEKIIYDSVYFAAVAALQQKDEPMKIKLEEKKDLSALFTPKTEIKQVEVNDIPPPPPARKVSLSIEYDLDDETADKITEKKVTPYDFTPIARNKTVLEDAQQQKTEYSSADDNSFVLSMPCEKEEKVEITEEKPQEVKTSKDVDFIVLGEAFKTYIIAQTENKLLFIDKHAAHERILFNKLKKRDMNIASQLLLCPVTVALSRKDYVAVCENLDIFRKSGYNIEDFGEGTVRVSECPTELSDADVEELVLEMADLLSKNTKEPEPQKLDWLYHSTACRAAIKAGDETTYPEMQELVKTVLTDEDVRYCPHGRPVMFEMSEYELKKQFGRLG